MFPKLAENPYQGKPLGVSFFREKKISGRRVYFQIYNKYIIVLMISISDKREQQKIINNIRENRIIYLEFVKDISNKESKDPS